MAHAQKPRIVFRLNGRVRLNRRGSQFSRLLASEVCASALVMLDTPRSEVLWEYWLPTPFAGFPFTSPPVRHRVPPHSESSIRPSWLLILPKCVLREVQLIIPLMATIIYFRCFFVSCPPLPSAEVKNLWSYTPIPPYFVNCWSVCTGRAFYLYLYLCRVVSLVLKSCVGVYIAFITLHFVLILDVLCFLSST